MSKIFLSGSITILRVLKKTKAYLFENIKEGDRIFIDLTLVQGHNGNKCYAVDIKVYFEEQDKTRTMSITEFNNVMKNFYFVQNDL